MEALLQQHPSEALAAFEASALALRATVALFASSQWLGQTLLQNPDLLQLLARPMGLEAARCADDSESSLPAFACVPTSPRCPCLLARFKRRELDPDFCPRVAGAGAPDRNNGGNFSALRCDDRARALALRE